MRRMGTIIGSVIAVIALITIFAFVLTGSSIFHLRMSAHVSASQLAADCAEAALADACNQLSQQMAKNPSTPITGPATTTLNETPMPGATTIVTFDRATATRNNMYVSYFNPTSSPTPTPTIWPAPAPPVAPQYLIPDNAVALCARAQVSGETRLAVAIVQWPQFSFALASSGKVQTSAGTVVEEEDAQGNIIPDAGDLGSN
ncbi:MAG: hypothetical protein ACYCW6_22215, partial [Candidatus Xenobia bacterium]